MILCADHLSIQRVLVCRAEGPSDAAAPAAPGRIPVTYAALYAQIDRGVRALNELGVGRGDRIAVLLPQGPEMAVASLVVAAGAVAVPLSPALRESDLECSFSALDVRAVILRTDVDSPARATALPRRGGVP